VTSDPLDGEDTIYEVLVKGHLGATMLGAFPGLRGEGQGPNTVLIGAIADQAVLQGLLAHIEDLGLELLGLRRVNEEADG
jgi:hypothetical protein